MKFNLEPHFYEIENGKKIKTSNKKIKNYHYIHKKNLIKEILKFKKNEELTNYYKLNNPSFWCKSFSDYNHFIKEKLEKNGLKIIIESNYITINDIQYPNILDENKISLDENKISLFSGDSYFVNELFKDFKPYLKNKNKINFISSYTIVKINRITEKFPHHIIKKIFKNHYYSQYELYFGLKENKVHFKLLPSRIISELENKKLNTYTKDIKFDLGYLFIRKGISEETYHEKKMFYKLLKISKFIFERANKNSCFVFSFSFGLHSSFVNYIFYISQFFKKIRIHKFFYSASIGLNVWIKCYGFIPNSYFPYDKLNYIEHVPEDILHKIYLWNNSNIETKLYEFNQTLLFKKNIKNIKNINFYEIVEKVKSYLLMNSLPLNIVYNNILTPYSYNTLNKNDMNKFIFTLYQNKNINIIFEYEQKYKNWLLCSALWNQRNSNQQLDYYFEKNIKNNMEEEENNTYLIVSSLKINIYHNIKINKIKNNFIFSIIDTNLPENILYYILNHSYICMIHKSVNLPHLHFYLFNSSDNYYFLKKNEIQL